MKFMRKLAKIKDKWKIGENRKKEKSKESWVNLKKKKNNARDIEIQNQNIDI